MSARTPSTFDHVRPVDAARLRGGDRSLRARLPLLDRPSGAEHLHVAVIRTPPGGGSPEGMHLHRFEQAFYVMEGTMTVEIGGRQQEVGPDSLVVFPAGEPHRNWNAGTVDTVHLAIGAPAPADDEPFSIPAP